MKYRNSSLAFAALLTLAAVPAFAQEVYPSYGQTQGVTTHSCSGYLCVSTYGSGPGGPLILELDPAVTEINPCGRHAFRIVAGLGAGEAPCIGK
jgi:hypothetical protein